MPKNWAHIKSEEMEPSDTAAALLSQLPPPQKKLPLTFDVPSAH